jgi:hypothetical protein
MDHGDQQPVKPLQSQPQLRAKKDKETVEGINNADSEPTRQAVADKGKGGKKQKATTAASSRAKATRKRKSRAGDDTGDNPPRKRKKSDPAAIRESIDEARQATADDDASSSTFHKIGVPDGPGPDRLEIVHTAGQSDEGTSAEVKRSTKIAGTKSTMEPTRRQPSRAASSRKSIL